MNDKINILSIGDVHGILEWSIPTFGGMDQFYKWQDDMTKDGIYPFQKYDKIIFAGDYVDSYNKSNLEILHNLKNIITFKRAYPDKVVLLTGNHDIQYMTSNVYCQCKGFRPEAFYDLHYLFDDNRKLFQMAFGYKNWLWTHAGVTGSFMNECVNSMRDKSYRFYEHTKDMDTVELLNFMLEVNNPDLYNVGNASGGDSMFPSPMWARPSELDTDPIMLNQIVGHTNYRNTVTRKMVHVSKKFKDVVHVYIDCLPSKQWYIQKDI